MQINLDSTQSKIFETGELIILEPMDPQPKDEFVLKPEGWLIEHKYLTNKYKTGDSVTIKTSVNDEYWDNEIYNCKYRIAMFPQDRKEEKEYLEYAESKPKHITKQATISEVMEPCRVQDVNKIKICRIIHTHLKYGGKTIKDQFKTWFNSRYSKPVPVECGHCENGKVKVGKIVVNLYKTCLKCNGDGIESYIGYLYEDDTLLSVKNDYPKKWKDKPFNIIINPWCGPYRIIKISISKKK